VRFYSERGDTPFGDSACGIADAQPGGARYGGFPRFAKELQREAPPPRLIDRAKGVLLFGLVFGAAGAILVTTVITVAA